jgi:iron complex outermembrane receptor protein
VTVITQDQIRALGITSIPEIMRLVPGMNVGITRGNDYQLSYLSPSILVNRRMNVLIDGMSVYRPGYSRVDWINLPVHINDIERIEVTRSPSSAVYGSNSFDGVINIITKAAEVQQNTRLEAQYGSINTTNGYIGYGSEASDNTHYHITLATTNNDGFDKDGAGNNFRDDTELDSFNLRGNTKFNNSEFDYAISGIKGVLTLDNTDPGRISHSDQYVEDLALNLNYTVNFSTHNTFKVHLDSMRGKHTEEWDSCYPAILFTQEMRDMFLANPDYAATLLAGGIPSGGTTQDDTLAVAVLTRAATMTSPTYLTNICGTINENFMEHKNVLSVEDTHVFSDTLRAVFGLGVNYNTTESETYLNGDRSDRKHFAFTNIEYKFSDFVLNAGVMYEQEKDRIKDPVTSPRFGLNYHVSPTDTIRISVSKAYRTPDLFEQTAYWSYIMREMQPALDGTTTEALFYFSAEGTGTLVSEEILSKEIGYYGIFPTMRSSLDIKLFEIQLESLIVEDDHFYNFHLTNNTDATRHGAEVELHILATDSAKIGAGYSTLDCESNHPYESQALCARHSGFANTTLNIDESWATSLAYYASTNISGYDYHRLDWILNYSHDSESMDLYGRLIVRHYFDEDMGFTYTQSVMIDHEYDNDTQYFVEAGVKF